MPFLISQSVAIHSEFIDKFKINMPFPSFDRTHSFIVLIRFKLPPYGLAMCTRFAKFWCGTNAHHTSAHRTAMCVYGSIKQHSNAIHGNADFSQRGAACHMSSEHRTRTHTVAAARINSHTSSRALRLIRSVCVCVGCFDVCIVLFFISLCHSDFRSVYY